MLLVEHRRRETGLQFTEAHADVLGGRESAGFVKFVETCCEAFCVLRRNRDLFIGLFSLMLGTGALHPLQSYSSTFPVLSQLRLTPVASIVVAGIPELQSAQDIAYLNESLVPELSELEAKVFFRDKIFDALENFRDRVNLDLAHALKH